MRAVQAFGFRQLVKTHVHKRHVGALGEGDGLCDESVGCTAVALIPARVSGIDEAAGGLSPGFEQLTRRFDARGLTWEEPDPWKRGVSARSPMRATLVPALRGNRSSSLRRSVIASEAMRVASPWCVPGS